MLDEAEKLAEKAKAAIKAALADKDNRYHSVVTFFMEFHRDDVGPDIAAELFPGNRPIQAVLCRDGGLFEAQAVRQSGG